jgi:hypothetical protein
MQNMQKCSSEILNLSEIFNRRIAEKVELIQTQISEHNKIQSAKDTELKALKLAAKATLAEINQLKEINESQRIRYESEKSLFEKKMTKKINKLEKEKSILLRWKEDRERADASLLSQVPMDVETNEQEEEEEKFEPVIAKVGKASGSNSTTSSNDKMAAPLIGAKRQLKLTSSNSKTSASSAAAAASCITSKAKVAISFKKEEEESENQDPENKLKKALKKAPIRKI